MDEFLDIERNIGCIKAIIGLQFSYEPEQVDESHIEYEKFAEPTQPVVQAKPADGDEPAEGEEAVK